MPAPRLFKPVPAAVDGSLFKVAILISLALHLLLLASAGGLIPPITPPVWPHSTLQVTVLKTPPSAKPARADMLAQHDSQGSASPSGDNNAPAASSRSGSGHRCGCRG